MCYTFNMKNPALEVSEPGDYFDEGAVKSETLGQNEESQLGHNAESCKKVIFR